VFAPGRYIPEDFVSGVRISVIPGRRGAAACSSTKAMALLWQSSRGSQAAAVDVHPPTLRFELLGPAGN